MTAAVSSNSLGNGSRLSPGQFPTISQPQFTADSILPLDWLAHNFRPLRYIGRPQPWLETAAFVEAMHARVGAAALQEDVMTILLPGGGKRGEHHRAAEPRPRKSGWVTTFSRKACWRPERSRLGAVISMQVETIFDSASHTKTVRPSRKSICSQMRSARESGCAAALTSETRNSASSEERWIHTRWPDLRHSSDVRLHINMSPWEMPRRHHWMPRV